MVIAVIIGEKAGEYVTIGSPAPLSKIKEAFRKLRQSDGGGLKNAFILSTRGKEGRHRFTKHQANKQNSPRTANPPSPVTAFAGDGGTVPTEAKKKGRPPSKKPKD